MIRLFVGIPVPPDVRQRLHVLAAGLQGAHWVSPENMHLTLRFIGNVEEYRGDDINDALDAIHEPSFEVTLSGIKTFGRGHMVHTIWADMVREPALLHLQGKIERALIGAGLDAERRKYTPHVTLARVRKSPKGKVAAWLADYGGLNLPPFSVDSFALYRSHQGHGGANYEMISSYDLG